MDFPDLWCNFATPYIANQKFYEFFNLFTLSNFYIF